MVENITQIKSGITINADASVKIRKNIIYAKKDYIWNPATCCCENGKYLASIFDDSIITCDEIIETTEISPTNFNEKKVTCKTKNFYILLAFLSITIPLLIAVSIYCCLKKYKAKQKHLLPYHVTNIKLKEVLY